MKVITLVIFLNNNLQVMDFLLTMSIIKDIWRLVLTRSKVIHYTISRFS